LSGISVTPSGTTTFVVHGKYVGADVGCAVGDFVVGDFVGDFVGCCANTHWKTTTKSSIVRKSICLSIIILRLYVI
jgi:hypothetical protein